MKIKNILPIDKYINMCYNNIKERLRFLISFFRKDFYL